MLSDAISFPKSNGLKPVLIGGVCLFFFWLFVPLFIVQGYQLRTMRAGSEGATDAPVFDDWGEMIVDGLKMVGVSLAYSIVPTLLYLVGMVIGAAIGGSAGGIVGGILMLLGGLGSLVAAYVTPAALTNLAREGEFGAAFDFDVIKTVATSVDYLVAIVLAIAVAMVGGVVAFVSAITIVGPLFVYFYLLVTVAYIYGRGFAAALEGTRYESASTTHGAGI